VSYGSLRSLFARSSWRHRRTFVAAAAALALAIAATPLAAKKTAAADEEKEDVLSAGTFAGLALREIGPALTSGRIIEVVVDPTDSRTWYVAAASGGVWKTSNGGITWKPLFDSQGSYSIGALALDPSDPLVVWVGTGENNSQRSVGYGDGVYRSNDGGATWKKVGLDTSEHIGKIVIDPEDGNRVFVAAQGPLWNAGGDRGLYRTLDGGATWKRVLEISEHTGVNEVVMDPRDSNVLYASSYQRRRHVWTLIDGGPESTIWKSTDGGDTWRKIESGLPSVDKGKIGLAISPVDPDVLYAIVEAAQGEGGLYRSTNRGESWEKRDDYVSQSPQYYNELVPDPHNVDRVYSLDTYLMVTEDGGANWRSTGDENKHIDNHALWIDPEDVDHLINGNDGGVYESFDRGKTWRYSPNLPITQFYRVNVDNATPFYNVYGGTQDNFSLAGPSRNTSSTGVASEEWIRTLGGDGFETVVDPEDPNIIYAQYQYGGLTRFDRKSGEIIAIQPQPEPGEPASRWNWDSALILSPHSRTRLYYAAQRLYRSDDRGNTWRAVSPDLTRQIDRNTLEVMGRTWSVDSVAKNASTSFFGNIVSLSESTLVEGLLYVGTDDGLVQVSEDGGATWRKTEKFPGVPDMTYVSDLEASRFDANVVYATFDNHKMGDFKPYVLVSADRGRTWKSIAGDLPARGTVYTLVQDHVKPELMFVGTEFSVYFTPDGGKRWIELDSLPTIAVRDLEIQRRENDLVLATFGRGFWILDDYTPLRRADVATLESPAVLFPVRETWAYMTANPLAYPGKGFNGETYYLAENPPFGAVFTYHLGEGLKSRRDLRREAEGKAVEGDEDVRYPSWDDLRAEDREEDPSMVLTVTDANGNVVRRLDGPASKGFHRVAWDLRTASPLPVDSGDSTPPRPMVAPGTYRVQLAKRVDGAVTPVGEAQTFTVKPLAHTTLGAADRAALEAFQRQTADLYRAVLGAQSAAAEAEERIDQLELALAEAPRAEAALETQVRALETRLADLLVELDGDPVIASRNEPVPPAIVGRVYEIVDGSWGSTSEPTATHRRAYEIAAEQFAAFLPKLRQLVTDLTALEAQAEAAGAPWTSGRVPTWPPR
jgi:photosystem II stability/assembly factor-like uncharacterized protein